MDDPNFSKVVVHFQRSDRAGNILDAPVIYQGRGERKVVNDLPDGTCYHFAVVAHNSAGEFNSNWESYSSACTLKAPRITSSVSDDAVTFGASVTIAGKLLAYEDSEDVWLPLPNRPMYQQRTLPDGTWERVDSGRTGEGFEIDGRAQGSIRFVREPAFNAEYRLYYPGFGIDGPTASSLAFVAASTDTRQKSGTSRARLVRVRPRVTATIRRATSRTAVMTGSVRPGREGSAVELQRKTSTGWRTVATGKLRSDRSYRLTHRPARAGTVTLRVLRPATRRNIAGRSGAKSISLR